MPLGLVIGIVTAGGVGYGCYVAYLHYKSTPCNRWCPHFDRYARAGPCPEGTCQTWCSPEPGGDCNGRRRLIDTSDDMTIFNLTDDEVQFTADCSDDDICVELLMGYNLAGGQSGEERCDELGLICNITQLDLFEDTVYEIYVNVTDECRYDTSFIAVDDGIERTWLEAREFCYDEYGADLATITDVNSVDFQYAVRDVSQNISLWTGIYSPNTTDCYGFTNGVCPEIDSCACVANDSWLDGEPLNVTEASECVRYLPDQGKLVNDMDCAANLRGFVCNVALILMFPPEMIPIMIPTTIPPTPTPPIIIPQTPIPPNRRPVFCSASCPNGSVFKTCYLSQEASCGCDIYGNPWGECH